MEIIFEILFELVFQLLLEVLFESGFRGAGRVLQNKVVRVGLGVVTGSGLAYWAGWWWGDRLSDAGRAELPNAFYVSLGLAAAFGALALAQTIRTRSEGPAIGGPPIVDRPSAPTEPSAVLRHLSPLHWSPGRLLIFATINIALAAGISVGFTPAAGVLR
jgi:hypothetical protein